MPGTLLRIHSAVLAERSGPTPARMNTLLEQPERLHLVHEAAQQRQVVAILGLDELRAGGDLLRQPQRAASHAAAPKGFSAAPKNTRGAKLILRPLWKRCSSRSLRAISSSEMQSRSNTGFACG